MKQATTNEFIIVDTQAEPIDLPEMLQRNYTVNKTAISEKATAFVDQVLEQGEPFGTVENLAAIQLFIKNIEADDRLNDYVVEELTKYGGKMHNMRGTKIDRIEAGVKYDFTNCGDSTLAYLEFQAEAAAKAVKERKEFLKKVPASGLVVTDTQSGEVETIYPPAKTSTTTYKVTLSNKDQTPEVGDDLPF